MIDIEVDDHAVRAWLNAMPAKVRQRLEIMVHTLTLKLQSHIVRDKLMGQVLNRRTGRLGQSIQTRVESTSNSVTGIVYSSGDVPYGRIHEYGGHTAAHVIEARNAQALAFLMNGKQIFARKVNHPGSNMPERSFMRSSLKDMSTEIEQGLKTAVGEGLKP